jgi:hypothetical protein
MYLGDGDFARRAQSVRACIMKFTNMDGSIEHQEARAGDVHVNIRCRIALQTVHPGGATTNTGCTIARRVIIGPATIVDQAGTVVKQIEHR